MSAQEKKKNEPVTIFINDMEYRVPEKKMTGAELKALGNVPAGNRLFKERPGPRPDKPIDEHHENQKVRNAEKGLLIVPTTLIVRDLKSRTALCGSAIR